MSALTARIACACRDTYGPDDPATILAAQRHYEDEFNASMNPHTHDAPAPFTSQWITEALNQAERITEALNQADQPATATYQTRNAWGHGYTP